LKVRFFGSYKDLEQGFVDDYVFDVKTWESYTDEELLGLLDYIEDYDLTSILVLVYESEES
jgi:hypothetical protein